MGERRPARAYGRLGLGSRLATVDTQTIGLSFAVIAGLILVMTLGVGPTVIGAGLLALLVVD